MDSRRMSRISDLSIKSFAFQIFRKELFPLSQKCNRQKQQHQRPCDRFRDACAKKAQVRNDERSRQQLHPKLNAA